VSDNTEQRLASIEAREIRVEKKINFLLTALLVAIDEDAPSEEGRKEFRELIQKAIWE
jgi:hypothetical protein